MRKIMIAILLATGILFAGGTEDKQARDAIKKAVKKKTISASDMQKYMEKINKGKANEVIKALSDTVSDNNTAIAASIWPKGKTVGWRNNGTGQYPDANPPTVWSRSESGAKKNIVWETKLPSYSWAS